MDIDNIIEKNADILYGKVNYIREKIPYGTDKDKFLLSLPFVTETTFRDDLDGDKIKTPIWTTYNSYTGEIEIPQYGKPHNAYTKVLIFQTGSREEPYLDPFDSNANRSAVFLTADKKFKLGNGMVLIPGCRRKVEDILNMDLPIIPYRLISQTQQQWESNPFGRSLQALYGKPDKFGNYPGDGVFLASIGSCNEKLRQKP